MATHIEDLTGQGTEHRSWMLPHEYYETLDPKDRRNVEALVDFVTRLPSVSDTLGVGQGGAIFAVGSTAIPPVLRHVEPFDINLLLFPVGSKKLSDPSAGVCLWEEMNKFFPSSALRGIFSSWEEKGDVYIFLPLNGGRSVTLDTIGSRRISLQDFLQSQLERLQSMNEDLEKITEGLTPEGHRDKTYNNAFAVRLA